MEAMVMSEKSDVASINISSYLTVTLRLMVLLQRNVSAGALVGQQQANDSHCWYCNTCRN